MPEFVPTHSRKFGDETVVGELFWGQPTCAIASRKCVFLTGTRSAESITASGHKSPITRQEIHGCTNQPRVTAKKTLAKAEPFTQSERYATTQVAAQSTGYPYGNRNDGELKGRAADVGIWHFRGERWPAGYVCCWE